MGTIKDIYDIVRNSVSDLKDLAKKAKNQEMLNLAMDIQDRVFEIKDQMQDIREENINLTKELEKTKGALSKYENKLNDYEELKKKLMTYENNHKPNVDMESILLSLEFTEIIYVYTWDTVADKKILETNLAHVFKTISLKMMTPISKREFHDSFTLLLPGYSLDEKQALEIKSQLLYLELIELSANKKDEEIIKLTNKGIKEMQKLNKGNSNI